MFVFKEALLRFYLYRTAAEEKRLPKLIQDVQVEDHQVAYFFAKDHAGPLVEHLSKALSHGSPIVPRTLFRLYQWESGPLAVNSSSEDRAEGFVKESFIRVVKLERHCIVM